jgi:phosphohistidine phosphatase SixA
MDGFGLAQWVRRERPWLKMILTSGAARTAEEAAQVNMYGPILAKPYDHAALERYIRALLEP